MLTLVFLSKDFCESDCPFNRLLPGIGFESKTNRLIFADRRKLKEVACDDDLRSLINTKSQEEH